MLEAILFYFFACMSLGGGLAVILSQNAVRAVLWLIFTFFNVAGLMLLLRAEFLAMILVIVYVGAIAILFLFVIMMLSVKESSGRFLRQLSLSGSIVGIVLGLELAGLGFFLWFSPTLFNPQVILSHIEKQPASFLQGLTNTEALGHILYTEYFILFQLAGIILLVAMIGAIVLTLRRRSLVKKQDMHQQSQTKRFLKLLDISPKGRR